MIREDFCGICAAVPVALAGFGVSTLDTESDRKRKKTLILFVCVISLIISIYLLIKYWDCSECRI